MKAILIAATVLFAITIPAQCWAQWDYCTEQISFDLFDGGFTLNHISTQFNCCRVLGTEVYQDVFSIDIVEKEIAGNFCMCVCCFDFIITMAGLDPGIYTVTLWKGAIGSELEGSWEISVDGNSDHAILTNISDCGGTNVEDVSTWGTVKTLYR